VRHNALQGFSLCSFIPIIRQLKGTTSNHIHPCKLTPFPHNYYNQEKFCPVVSTSASPSVEGARTAAPARTATLTPTPTSPCRFPTQDLQHEADRVLSCQLLFVVPRLHSALSDPQTHIRSEFRHTYYMMCFYTHCRYICGHTNTDKTSCRWETSNVPKCKKNTTAHPSQAPIPVQESTEKCSSTQCLYDGHMWHCHMCRAISGKATCIHCSHLRCTRCLKSQILE
jgi:hypothetical protein